MVTAKEEADGVQEWDVVMEHINEIVVMRKIIGDQHWGDS